MFWPLMGPPGDLAWSLAEKVLVLEYQPIITQYSGHVTSVTQSEVSIQVTWSVLTIKRPVLPGECWGPWGEALKLLGLRLYTSAVSTPPVTSANQRTVFGSRDLFRPIRGQYWGHMISIHLLSSPPSLVSQMPWPLYSHLSSLLSLLQYSPMKARTQVKWSILTNRRPVLRC